MMLKALVSPLSGVLFVILNFEEILTGKLEVLLNCLKYENPAQESLPKIPFLFRSCSIPIRSICVETVLTAGIFISLETLDFSPVV